jgi:ribosomal protein S12 methylthiotransferase
MQKKSIYLTTLGCAKNEVDSSSMAQLLDREGYRFVSEPRQAEVLIVNTCGFIQEARDESLEALRKLAKRKRPGQLLVAAGCLPQRLGREAASSVPGVDGILGTRRWMDIIELVARLKDSRGAAGATMAPAPLYHIPDVPTIGTDERGTLRASISGASAYLKIADGCRRPCAFCSIPLIKGTAVSRPVSRLLEEAKILQDRGVRELILIAQDTTDYGHDLGMKDGLAQLLEELAPAVPGIAWIRLMYAFPGYVTSRLIDVMAGSRQVLPYLDIPLQHASPAVLCRMVRPADPDWVHATISKMRTAMPSLAIRTTFIVGYPGETEQDFRLLLDFVEEMRFDRLGAFKYSFEPGTSSAVYGDPIPAEAKEERYQRLMELQQRISLQINQSFIGRKMDVLVEGRQKAGSSIGRSYRDAPQIDGVVLVEGDLQPGSLVPIRITGALEYDLTGVPAGK